jgi:hypothetical protein
VGLPAWDQRGALAEVKPAMAGLGRPGGSVKAVLGRRRWRGRECVLGLGGAVAATAGEVGSPELGGTGAGAGGSQTVFIFPGDPSVAGSVMPILSIIVRKSEL